MQPLWINFSIHRSERISHQLSYLRHDVSPYVDVQVWMVLLNVTLKILETELIAILIFAVVLRKFLHCVIREMDEFVVYIFQIEFFAARADIGIFIEIALEVPVYRSEHAVTSEIKLPTMYQQWVVDVALDNEGLIMRLLI